MPENNSALKLTKSKMPQVGITAGWFEDWGATYKLYGGSAESGVGLVCTVLGPKLNFRMSNLDLHYPQAFHVLRADEFTLRWTSLAPFGIQNLHA